MSRIPELNHLQLPLNDIISATNNFSERNYVGRGGFGRVYKGQLQPSGITVAVKRLDTRFGQGENEFLKEILMLASYKHENLVSLVGFCDQGQEKILVYKHEDNGSLDKHLASTNLTWEQRLRICLGAACGLDYLHNGVGEGHRVVHRDIKSSNILLDANWKAKISDFGLSKFAPKNQQFTFLVTNACGTIGYLDPDYTKTGVLTKESDVYSFGIVLFEVLCGRLAMVYQYEDERRFLYWWVKLNDKNKKLQQIIIPFLREQMKPNSISVFFKIALQCLDDKRQQRPTMRKVVKELETALEAQLFSLSGKDVYRKSFLKGPTHPKCEIPANGAGLIEYRCHPFWSQKYCAAHEHDNTTRCCSCERLESANARYVSLGDGRSLCLECKESAIMDPGDCQPLYYTIRDYYEGMNMRIDQLIPMFLVERQALHGAIVGEKHGFHHMPEIRGLCLSEEQTVASILKRPKSGGHRLIGRKTQPQKLTRRCEVTAILVLYGLPRLLTGAILANQLMHAWLRLKGYRNLNPEVEEGICQMLSYMWLENEVMPGSTSSGPSSSSSVSKKGGKSRVENKLGEFFMHQIAHDASPVYGGGFRAANAAVNTYGLRRTLDHIHLTGSFPLT
ncbi:DA1-related protein 2 [Artemisia annua]|uniref:DA1-related protein 2 n=1 Tax=Artemisia annua TaxID=35608 RepID=A0A2U1KPZ3_ARTAN|nr:DA1-related protein 2 [Artemisia annua]